MLRDFSQKFLFYAIKNAKACAEKKASIDQVGIHALDDLTLTIELETPNPYFLSFIASRSYLPVNSKIDKTQNQKELVSNGPFLLKKWTPGYEILLQKKPTYWDAKHVYLKGIRIQIIPETMTQCDLYQKRQVDYIGSPLSLFFDPDLLLKHPLKNELKTKETATVFCLMVNTEKKSARQPKLSPRPFTCFK